MIWIGASVLVVALLAVSAACTSLGKDELAARLAAVPGNDVLASALRQVTVDVDLDGRRRSVNVSFAHLPRLGAPRLVLVHGAPGTLFNWSELISGTDEFAGLADDFDVTAIELAGHGLSRDGVEPRTFQECADVLGATLAHLGAEPAIVVAQSYGGEVAWRMALDRPDLVARLVLVDSSGYPRRDDEWLPEEEVMRSLPGAGFGWLLNARERIGSALEPHFHAPPPATFHDELFLVCENAENWRTTVGLCRDENGTRAAELTTLAVPTLLVWGEHDIAYPIERFARQFERDIPDAELVVMSGLGHYPPQEDPAAFAALLRAHVAR